MRLPAESLEILEHLNTHSPLQEGSERVERDRYVVWIGDPASFGLAEPIPQLTVVQRLRVPDGELPAVVEEVRALLRERGRQSATWEIGPTAQPADAAEGLLALGMVPDPEEHEIAGMAHVGPEQPMPGGVEVRRAVTIEERIDYRRVLADGFGLAPAADDELRRLAERGDDGVTTPYVAYVDGEPVAAASSMLFTRTVVLTGASTREVARGRGAFRALVSARIADARAQGVDVAVVAAGAMSRPILERNGFERVMTMRVYVDQLA